MIINFDSQLIIINARSQAPEKSIRCQPRLRERLQPSLKLLLTLHQQVLPAGGHRKGSGS